MYLMNATFNKIKEEFISGKKNWYDLEYRTIITCEEDIQGLQKTLECFSKYLLNAYNILFIETELGVGHITCINDTGIRVQYFGAFEDDEWINHNHIGNIDATKRTLIEQK